MNGGEPLQTRHFTKINIVCISFIIQYINPPHHHHHIHTKQSFISADDNQFWLRDLFHCVKHTCLMPSERIPPYGLSVRYFWYASITKSATSLCKDAGKMRQPFCWCERKLYILYTTLKKKASLIVRLSTQEISLHQAYQRLIREYHDLAQKDTILGHIC